MGDLAAIVAEIRKEAEWIIEYEQGRPFPIGDHASAILDLCAEAGAKLSEPSAFTQEFAKTLGDIHLRMFKGTVGDAERLLGEMKGKNSDV